MQRVLPNRPGRVLAMLGFFVVAATLGWSGEKRVYVQYQSGAKGPVMAALAQAGGRVHYEFDHLGAVAVSLPEQALNGISRNPHVTLVEEDPIRELHGQVTPYGIGMVQAPTAIAAGATGAGIIVGVIDSGVLASHEDFANLPLNGEPTGSFSTESTWFRDRSSHGTHVVGTIAAANNPVGVVGVAPGVGGIYMVKVFGDSGNWIYSSSLLTAVQRAVQNGQAQVINMSLGGGTKSRTEENGLNNLYNNGVLLIASAGNAGNTTTSYPAGYASVMSVAAVDSLKALASFSQRNSTVEIAAPGVGVLSTVSYRNGSLTVDGVSYISSALEGSMQASVNGALVDGSRATSAGNWVGKVVLVERGDIAFADKVANVQTGGGVAAVIYNNVPGAFSGTLGGATFTIPAISITQEDGQDLVANKLGVNAVVSSVATLDTSGYDYYDGTSMAAPHVSGVAALVWSKYYPGATNKQVRQALIESAEDLGTAGRDNSFGYGLVRANNAMTRLGQLVGGGGGGDITPPVISNVSTATSKGKPGAQGSFTVSFTTNEPATSVVNIPDLGSNGTKTTSLGTSHTVTFQGVKSTTYLGTITATDAATNSSSAPFMRNN